MPKSRKSPLPHSSSPVKNNIPSKLTKEKLKQVVRALLLVYHPNKCQRRQTAKSDKRTNSILFGHNFAPIWKRPQRRRNRRDCGC